MRRKKTSDRQLAIEWTEAMRWQDLPALVRERVRKRLAELLHQAAGYGAPAPEEPGDDE